MKRLNFRRMLESASCIAAHAAVLSLSAAITLLPATSFAQQPGVDPPVSVPEKPADQSEQDESVPSQPVQPADNEGQQPQPAQAEDQLPPQDRPAQQQNQDQRNQQAPDEPTPGQADQDNQERAGQQPPDQRNQQAGRGELGVMLATQNGRTQVTQVLRESAAAEAGFQAGDVIVSVDGENVSDDRQLAQMIGTRRAGEQVEIIVERGGQQQTLTATLNARRTAGYRGEVGGGQQMTGAWLGVLLEDAQDQPSADGQQRGAQVRQVYPGGPAARSGLRSGDIITRVGDTAIESPQDLAQAIDSRSPGEEVTFTVARGDAEQQLTAQLGDRGEFAFESGDEPGAPRLQGDSQAGFEDDRFGGISDHSMMLEQHRRFAEQHQRIESLVVEVLNELTELRKEVQQLKNQSPTQRQTSPPDQQR